MFDALLRPELLISISSSGTLHLKESDGAAVLRKLSVMRVPANTSAFTLDYSPSGQLKKSLGKAFSQLSCLIAANHTLANKSCDVVLATRKADRVDVLLADLKSTRPNRSECKKQLRNSELYVNYLFSLLREYHGVELNPTYRKVIFYAADPILAKKPTNQKNAPKRPKDEDVTFFPVTLAGRNNVNAVVDYSELL